MANKLPNIGIQGFQIGNNPERAAVELLSMSVGGSGFTYTTSSVGCTGHKYYSLTALTNCVISTITFAESYTGDDSIIGITIPAGTTVFFNFTDLTLTSGTGLAYFV